MYISAIVFAALLTKSVSLALVFRQAPKTLWPRSGGMERSADFPPNCWMRNFCLCEYRTVSSSVEYRLYCMTCAYLTRLPTECTTVAQACSLANGSSVRYSRQKTALGTCTKWTFLVFKIIFSSDSAWYCCHCYWLTYACHLVKPNISVFILFLCGLPFKNLMTVIDWRDAVRFALAFSRTNKIHLSPVRVSHPCLSYMIPLSLFWREREREIFLFFYFCQSWKSAQTQVIFKIDCLPLHKSGQLNRRGDWV